MMVEYLKVSRPDPELVKCICYWRAEPIEVVGPPVPEIGADGGTRSTVIRGRTEYRRMVRHTINPKCWYHRELLMTRMDADGGLLPAPDVDAQLDKMPPKIVKFRFSGGQIVSVTREEVATGFVDLAAALRDGRIEHDDGDQEGDDEGGRDEDDSEENR